MCNVYILYGEYITQSTHIHNRYIYASTVVSLYIFVSVFRRNKRNILQPDIFEISNIREIGHAVYRNVYFIYLPLVYRSSPQIWQFIKLSNCLYAFRNVIEGDLASILAGEYNISIVRNTDVCVYRENLTFNIIKHDRVYQFYLGTIHKLVI